MTSASIEVVSEGGVLLHDGVVVFKAPDLQLMERGMTPLKYLHDASLADANPVVLRDLPDDMDGLDVEATARVPGLATAAAKFTIHLHRAESARLIVPRGRSARVHVVEIEGASDVEGASVVSVIEAKRRGLDPQELRRKSGPGSAITDAAGLCEVGDLGPGEHEFEIDAPGHERGRAKWTDGPLLVRLERVKGTGTVSVTVFGLDGRPAAGVVVELMSSDRKSKTDEHGVAVFDGVAAGKRFFTLDLSSVPDARKWEDKIKSGLADLAALKVEPGGRYNVQLGMRPAGVTFEGRLLTEDGRPLAGLKVSLFADMGMFNAISDATGSVRFADLPPSTLAPLVGLERDATWFFDDIEAKAGESRTATLVLGTATIRGHVQRTSRAPVANAQISISGPLRGLGTTDADGRFEFSHARSGRYRIEVDAKSAGGFGARPVEITVPSETESVIELVECGRVAVRFATPDRPHLREAKVEMKSATGEAVRLSDPKSGDADLVASDVLPGSYTITVAADGRTREVSADVKSGATTVVELASP